MIQIIDGHQNWPEVETTVTFELHGVNCTMLGFSRVRVPFECECVFAMSVLHATSSLSCLRVDFHECVFTMNVLSVVGVFS